MLIITMMMMLKKQAEYLDMEVGVAIIIPHYPTTTITSMIIFILIVLIIMIIIVIFRKQAEHPEREVDVETLLAGDLDENLNR